MLIVIVVIWILAWAILPKILWVMARARDTKRVADLRDIAMAIQMYKMDYGEYPENPNHPWKYLGSVWSLSESLLQYMKKIPKDPQKNSTLWNLHDQCVANKNCDLVKYVVKKGEYFYQVFDKAGKSREWILITKAETPSIVNFVNEATTTKTVLALNYSNLGAPFDYFEYFCSSVKKWSVMKIATKNNSECIYTDESQLYHIVKI